MKHRKKGVTKDAGKFAYKTIGVVPLELHTMTDSHNESMALPLQWCSRDGAVINTVVTVVDKGSGGVSHLPTISFLLYTTNTMHRSTEG